MTRPENTDLVQMDQMISAVRSRSDAVQVLRTMSSVAASDSSDWWDPKDLAGYLEVLALVVERLKQDEELDWRMFCWWLAAAGAHT